MRIISFIDSLIWSRISLNIWVSGKSPRPLQTGTKEKKWSLLTPPTPSSF